MKRIALWMSLFALLLTACTTSAQANPAERFSGTWTGTMSFSDDPAATVDVVVTIPSGCSTGGTCGDIYNKAGCQWQMTLVSLKENVFAYKFSKTLAGGDPCEPGVGTGGTLTLNPDGSLVREHKTPDFTASGNLSHQ